MRIRPWLCTLIGVGAAFVGLLPWLVTGMRLPLQNWWELSTPPEAMPLAMLPFSQYSLSLIFALLVVGASAAGIAARALRPRMPRGGFALVVTGLVVIQAIAIAQSTVAVAGGLRDGTESVLYLWALVVVSVLSLLVGVLAVFLIARAPRAGALIGLTIGAIATTSWLTGFMGLTTPYELVALIQWVAPVLVGATIAWTGLGTTGRIIAALASIAMVWIVPAAITAATAAVGMRVLARQLGEMAEYALQVFGLATFTPELAWRPIVVTVVVAAIGLAARSVLSRRDRRNIEHGAPDTDRHDRRDRRRAV
ncbi:hypothetical protein [Microbacterium immunditiarum]|uniref:Uncharacterized protein n=1 Tax=Microbacterium immunditiarum TaxID=337480 RepID=A0A7Y9GN42_9MICO|nr:hypothetical protein [Microbacterium immunditiarum]NYE19437.1 hypothetical protein [Microbacterium immunditiarum]